MDDMVDEVELDFIILADHAEILNGKTYIMGGAWNQYAVVDTSQHLIFAVVIGLIVNWHGTNKNHIIDVSIEDEDGNIIGETHKATLTVGRSVHAIEGQSFRVSLALRQQLLLPKIGTYRVVASTGGKTKTATFFTTMMQVE